MRKLKEILRLKHEGGMGVRSIARCLGLSHSTVIDYLCAAPAMPLLFVARCSQASCRVLCRSFMPVLEA